jgi:hypothetical protein
VLLDNQPMAVRRNGWSAIDAHDHYGAPPSSSLSSRLPFGSAASSSLAAAASLSSSSQQSKNNNNQLFGNIGRSRIEPEVGEEFAPDNYADTLDDNESELPVTTSYCAQIPAKAFDDQRLVMLKWGELQRIVTRETNARLAYGKLTQM